MSNSYRYIMLAYNRNYNHSAKKDVFIFFNSFNGLINTISKSMLATIISINVIEVYETETGELSALFWLSVNRRWETCGCFCD